MCKKIDNDFSLRLFAKEQTFGTRHHRQWRTQEAIRSVSLRIVQSSIVASALLLERRALAKEKEWCVRLTSVDKKRKLSSDGFFAAGTKEGQECENVVIYARFGKEDFGKKRAKFGAIPKELGHRRERDNFVHMYLNRLDSYVGKK